MLKNLQEVWKRKSTPWFFYHKTAPVQKRSWWINSEVCFQGLGADEVDKSSIQRCCYQKNVQRSLRQQRSTKDAGSHWNRFSILIHQIYCKRKKGWAANHRTWIKTFSRKTHFRIATLQFKVKKPDHGWHDYRGKYFFTQKAGTISNQAEVTQPSFEN